MRAYRCDNSLRSSWLCVDLYACRQPTAVVIDATRKADGRLVCIKRIKTESHHWKTKWDDDTEMRMAVKFQADVYQQDPRNHCVPVYDIFLDEDRRFSYIVMPFLRPIDELPLESIADMADFVGQLLDVSGENMA